MFEFPPSRTVVPKLFKICYLTLPYQKFFLPALVWSRGSFKLSVVGNAFYTASLNLLGISATAKQVNLLRSYHSYFLQAQFCTPVLMNVSK